MTVERTEVLQAGGRSRLIVVYNPRSSRAKVVRQEVLDPALKLKGWTVGKFEVTRAKVEENVAKLATILKDGDLLVAAGGDGTATVAANAVLRSDKKVVFAVLPYGNFNDMARMLGSKSITEVVARFERGLVREIYPLEAVVDGKHWRYAPCYVTLGLFAESTSVFEQDKVRQKLRARKRGLFFSVWNLAKWYFGNRKRDFLPEGRLNGRLLKTGTTDYLAVNSKSMARVMRGGKWYEDFQVFQSGTASLKSFWRLGWFMLLSIVRRVPGAETRGDVLTFERPNEIEIHAEGEYQRLKNVERIEVRKAEKSLTVIKNQFL